MIKCYNFLVIIWIEKFIKNCVDIIKSFRKFYQFQDNIELYI